jgi:hypothetical protein
MSRISMYAFNTARAGLVLSPSSYRREHRRTGNVSLE